MTLYTIIPTYLFIGAISSLVVFHYTLHEFDFVYRAHRALRQRGVTLNVDTMSVVASIIFWPAYIVGAVHYWREGRELVAYMKANRDQA